jgi:hypothetical protein
LLDLIEQLSENYGRPMATDLNHVFTGERMWGFEETDQRGIEHLFRPGEEDLSQSYLIWSRIELWVSNKGAKYLDRLWSTHANHADRTSSGRRGDCDYGVHRISTGKPNKENRTLAL